MRDKSNQLRSSCMQCECAEYMFNPSTVKCRECQCPANSHLLIQEINTPGGLHIIEDNKGKPLQKHNIEIMGREFMNALFVCC